MTLQFVNSRFDTARGLQLEDGRILSLTADDGTALWDYDRAFSLETGEVFPSGQHPEGSITLNELKNAGRLIECYPYDEYDYTESVTLSEVVLNDELYSRIQRDFLAHGFNVTTDAIRFCLEAWTEDLKSSYRDEANGYHMFCPCGLNTLSLRTTTLSPLCADWQTTYRC
jgi:hypothetical protein